MHRDDMIERVYAKTTLDMDQIESLTDDQLRDLLGLTTEQTEPVKPVTFAKPAKQSTPRIKPVMSHFEFVEHENTLYQIETWTTGSIDQRVRVKSPSVVRFEGRSVSASIVLHWLRTGDLVKRVPRKRKTWQAAIRVDGKVKHLGRFATREERDTAVLNYRLGFVPSK